MNSTHASGRRQFLKTLGTASAAAPFIARSLHAAAPSRVLRHASFGAAGMAWNDIQAICSNPFVKLVAVAEVDLNRLEHIKRHHPDAKVYQDWRQLLDREAKNLDSVNVSTPDHLHAPIAMSAMQLGKHCYVEKPLAHDLHEVRALTRFAREKKLVTQMGIQIHSFKVYRQAVALVQGGAIGKVKEVHSWSSKREGELKKDREMGRPPERGEAVPSGLDWDLWLGVSAARPYVGNGYYHPYNWRRRLDFGTGTFGDMGCHIFDPVFRALDLTAPISVRSDGPAPDAWNWSTDARIRYVFPGTRFTAGSTLPVFWYDGDQQPPAEIRALVKPPRPEEPLDIDRKTGEPVKGKGDGPSQGSILVGTEGVLHIPHIAPPRLFPVEKFKGFTMPATEHGHHWSLWADACIGNGAAPSANFDYSGPLTESVLLGSVAVRFPQTTLAWNSARLQFDNEKAANQFVRRAYRKGWEVAGL
jgi:predicted dehydrogenase